MTYRLRNIMIAIVVAGLAAMLTVVYLREQKERLQNDQKPTTVFVAGEDIAVGTPGSQVADMLEEREVAREDVVPGAIVARDDLQGKVATEQIYTGEQVTALRFSSPSEQGIRAQISGTERAIQVPGDPHQILAGTLQDGDRVDVVGSWKVPEQVEFHFSRTILRDILVLRAPTTADVAEKLTDSETPAQAVMLALTDAQAQKLFWITQNGEWSLELRPAQDSADSPEGAETTFTLLRDGLTTPKVRKLLFDPLALAKERNAE
jgi:Flp pilus assembly protein CpaB